MNTLDIWVFYVFVFHRAMSTMPRLFWEVRHFGSAKQGGCLRSHMMAGPSDWCLHVRFFLSARAFCEFLAQFPSKTIQNVLIDSPFMVDKQLGKSTSSWANAGVWAHWGSSSPPPPPPSSSSSSSKIEMRIWKITSTSIKPLIEPPAQMWHLMARIP